MKNLTIEQAIKLLSSGEVVAIPTETVYGLAADARKSRAVKKIFKAKNRPSDNPLIVHIGYSHQVDKLAKNISDEARLLMKHFWPGPLTLVLESNGKVSKWVTAGLDTIALRMPAHEKTLRLLQKSKIPLAAPSANLSGKPSPTCVEHVIHDLKERIPGVVNGGVCGIGIESTVIDMTAVPPVILRPGGIKKQQIEALIGGVDLADFKQTPEDISPKAPGMKYAHYAPAAEVFIVKGDFNYFKALIEKYQADQKRVGILCRKSNRCFYKKADMVKSLSVEGKQLYKAFRLFDDSDVDIILCEWFEDEAVMNRLMKASKENIL